MAATSASAGSTVSPNPAKAFADAAIEQIDRIAKAVDDKLGGALTKLSSVFGPAVAADAPARPMTTTGYAPRPASSSSRFTPDAALTLDGMVRSDGMSHEYKTSEADNVGGAMKVFRILSSLNNFVASAKVVLETSEYMLKGNAALALQADLARGVNATADLNIGPFMQKLETAMNGLQSLQSLCLLGRSPQVGRSVVPERAAVVASSAI